MKDYILGSLRRISKILHKCIYVGLNEDLNWADIEKLCFILKYELEKLQDFLKTSHLLKI